MEVIGIVVTDLKPEQLNAVYKDIAEHLGINIALLIFEHFKGLQVTFPTRFLSREYIRDKICSEYNGDNISELARKYQYSGRWVREIVSKGNHPEVPGE
ncbi:MAG: Mor transcription activator family [Bacillota bacterium]|nr:MAG: Mor transcription activator family [Bacillota bacterium]